MLHIAIQVKELVSSNLNTLVESASNPVKMLRLLRHELQEYIVALQGDLTRAQRRQERLTAEAAKLDRSAADWTEKAQLAMTHKREDLARAALLAREVAGTDAERLRDEAAQAQADAAQAGETIAALEAKLAETNARLEDEVARIPPKPAPGPSGSATRSERFLDRVATLEKRVDFAAERRPQPAPASVDAEIEQLRREAKVTAELEAMKAATRPAPARKAKAKR